MTHDLLVQNGHMGMVQGRQHVWETWQYATEKSSKSAS
jgi:hypothetical protein